MYSMLSLSCLQVGEILRAGADVAVKGLDGKTPMQLASKPELIALLKEYEAKATAKA
jgi:2,3-bisphosphoglycerate-independent phosphoglycerate mutase